MHQHQHQQSQTALDFQTSKNIVYVCLMAWAMSIRVPLRKRCGRNYIGVFWFISPVWLFLVAGITNTPELVLWIPVFWGGCLFNALTEAIARRRRHVHTYYWGDKWIGRICTFFIPVKDGDTVGEGIASAAIAVAFLHFTGSENACAYFLYGFFPLFVTEAMNRQVHTRRIDSALDARADQQLLHEELRGR